MFTKRTFQTRLCHHLILFVLLIGHIGVAVAQTKSAKAAGDHPAKVADVKKESTPLSPLGVSGGVSISDDATATPDASAMLDVSVTGSSKKGVLVPRVTQAELVAIASPATGLLLFQTDGTAGFYYYDGVAWTQITTGAGSGFSLPYSGTASSAGMLFSVTNSGTGAGVAGFSSAAFGVAGVSNTSRGVYGQSISGDGVAGFTESGRGVSGQSSTAGYDGVFGQSDGNNGNGVRGFANNGPQSYGVWGISTNGYGMVCSGKFYQSGSIFEAHPTSTVWTTNKPATVKLNDGAKVKLFAEEAAEIFFNDYGEATLQNGRTRVELDPKFLQTVTLGAQHPMKVFVQLEGDCKGVYVTNKTATGFDVVELQSGTSNARFSYRVVCKRKYYEDERLATEEQDIQYNTRMYESAWPEILAKQKAERESINAMSEQDKLPREQRKSPPAAK